MQTKSHRLRKKRHPLPTGFNRNGDNGFREESIKKPAKEAGFCKKQCIFSGNPAVLQLQLLRPAAFRTHLTMVLALSVKDRFLRLYL